jgi:superfamily I DNA and/or RNA helicase
MHEAIMAFPSRALYEGRLVAHPSVAHHTVGERAPLQLLDSAGKGWGEERPEGSESLCNPGEAERVVREVHELVAAGLRPEEIGVIAPYAAQVALLRSLLPDEGFEVDTVDAFQGREKEAVVVSLVRSNDAGDLGFCADVRRLNVALTRARRRLLVVGDSATLGAHPFHEALWQHAQATGAYTSAWEE